MAILGVYFPENIEPKKTCLKMTISILELVKHVFLRVLLDPYASYMGLPPKRMFWISASDRIRDW